jgi:hypothetical protein
MDMTVVPKQNTKLSAAPENLFVVNKDYKNLDLVKAQAIHDIVPKAPYVMKQGRPTIIVAIAFSMTRACQPNLDN